LGLVIVTFTIDGVLRDGSNNNEWTHLRSLIATGDRLIRRTAASTALFRLSPLLLVGIHPFLAKVCLTRIVGIEGLALTILIIKSIRTRVFGMLAVEVVIRRAAGTLIQRSRCSITH
jgi:hypothetical protein